MSFLNRQSLLLPAVLAASVFALPSQAQDLSTGEAIGNAVENAGESAGNAISRAGAAIGDFASDLPQSIFQGWGGSASLGATYSGGNAETSNINGKLSVAKRVDLWEHKVFATLFKGRSALLVADTDSAGNPVFDDSGRRTYSVVRGNTSDRLALGYQPRYHWRPDSYLFGLLDWETDDPAGIDSATRELIGIGHNVYRNDSGYFTVEAGMGNKSINATSGGADVDNGILYVGGSYLNLLSERLQFNADARIDFGGDNTFYDANLGLAYRISDNLSLGVSQFLRGNTDVESVSNPLSSSTDYITTINLMLDI